MRRFGIVVCAMAVAVGIGACSEDDEDNTIRYTAVLTGGGEPTPVVTNATGDFTLVDNGASMQWTLNVSNIQNVTLAHIHAGVAGVNGGVLVNLLPNGVPNPPVTTGVLSTGTFTQANIQGLAGAAPITMDSLRVLMRTGAAYVNVHNSANPGGHIRGQLRLD
jgi:hypothetical protein